MTSPWADPIPATHLEGYLAARRDELLSNSNLCRALLNDDLKDQSVKADVLAQAVDAGVPRRLAKVRASSPAEVDKLAREFSQARAVTSEAGRWAVITWAIALGLLDKSALKASTLPDKPGAEWFQPRPLLGKIDRHAGEAAAQLRNTSGLSQAQAHVLGLALADRVNVELESASGAPSLSLTLERLASRLHQRHALLPAAAKWSVDSWAFALGIVSETDFAESRGNEEKTSEPMVLEMDFHEPKGRPESSTASRAPPRGLEKIGAGVGDLFEYLGGIPPIVIWLAIFVGIIVPQLDRIWKGSDVVPLETKLSPVDLMKGLETHESSGRDSNPPGVNIDPERLVEKVFLNVDLTGRFVSRYVIGNTAYSAVLELDGGDGRIYYYLNDGEAPYADAQVSLQEPSSSGGYPDYYSLHSKAVPGRISAGFWVIDSPSDRPRAVSTMCINAEGSDCYRVSFERFDGN